MISICIPVYNFDVTALVRDLHSQASGLNIPFEIIVMDDLSDEPYRNRNRAIQSLQHVKYIELSSKAGRSAIRNRLASESSYDTLLFMDCDSVIPDDHYIENYKLFIGKNTVIFGGRTYEERIPESSLYLRWYYGVKRETKKAVKRNKYPYRSFMTNNFLIPKNILQTVPFEESFESYGHEDTLMGYRLKKAGVPLVHIDNSLIHAGLEPAGVFISKTEKALDNLLYILRNPEYTDFYKDVRVLRVFRNCKRFFLTPILSAFFRIFRKMMLKNLMGRMPSLFIFDVYKIGYLCYNEKK